MQLLGAKATYSEEQLVAGLKSKDQKAFEYLYDNYSQVLYGFLHRLIPSEDQAADLLQEVFIKIYNNIPQYDPSRGRLYTWLINLTRNTGIDYLRSGSHQKELKNQNVEDSVYTINQQENTETKTDTIGIKNIIGKLPEEQQKVIDLVYFKGYTQDETSKILNIPLGTVKTRVRMAIGTLRGIFKE